MIKGIDYIGVSAGAMIINDLGEIFLAQRGPKAKNERGCWENPGGSVDFGEKLVDAVEREIMEEYGAEIEILEQFPAEKQHWVATTFLARFKVGSVSKIMEPDKCSAIGFFHSLIFPNPFPSSPNSTLLITSKLLKNILGANMKTHKDCSDCSHDCCKRPMACNPGGAFYGLGLIGAAVYYFPHLGNGSEFFLTLVKIIFWPAFLVHRALSLLSM